VRFAAGVVCTLLIAGCGSDEPADPKNDRPEETQGPTGPDTGLPPASSASATNGQAIYVQSCLLCHQHDGGGVPNMQPPLVGSEIVAGEAEALIELTLRGIGGTPPSLPASGAYAMVMPGAMHLNDQQIADLLTYIRQEYADADAVSAEEVAAVRSGLE
jgi:mono/diheme cytochrome c family protein